MHGYRIKLINAKLDSYWYAGHIGAEYWAILDHHCGEYTDYQIIFEGSIPHAGSCTRWVDYTDCCILSEANIKIETLVTVSVTD